MDLVDDIHTHFHLSGRIDGIVPQITDIVNAVVGSGIDLQNIHAGTAVDSTASIAAVAGVAIVGG
jgi:hypothetical protein